MGRFLDEGKFLDENRAAVPKGQARSIVGGALEDTLGTSGRPGASSNKVGSAALGALEDTGRMIVDPHGLTEHAVSLGIKIPAMMAMPGGAMGRMALGAAEGAGRGISQGRSLGWEALLDAALTGATEVVGGLGRFALGRVAKPLEEARGAFKYATEAPGKFYEQIKGLLPRNATITVPSLSEKPMTVRLALDRLARLEHAKYDLALREISTELERLYPMMGDVMKGAVWKERFTPVGTFAQRVAAGARTPQAKRITQGVADALATEPVAGVPAGAIAGSALGGDALLNFARRWVPRP